MPMQPDTIGVLDERAARSVFVDGTGRRRRIATAAGALLAATLLASLAAVGLSLVAGGSSALPGWPERGGGQRVQGEVGSGPLGVSPGPVRTRPGGAQPVERRSSAGAPPSVVPAPASPVSPSPSATQSFPGRSGEHRNGTGKPTRTPPGKAK